MNGSNAPGRRGCCGRPRLLARPVFVVVLAIACLAAAVSRPLAASSGSPLPALAAPAFGAATSGATPKPPSDPGQAAEFVGRLDDRQARAVLLETLQQHAAQSGGPDKEGLGEVFGEASRQLQDAGARLGLLVTATTEFRQVPRLLGEHLSLGQTGVLNFSVRLLCVAAGSLLAEFVLMALLAWMMRRPRPRGAARAVAWAVRVSGFVAFSAMAAVLAVTLAESLPGQQQRFLLRLSVAFWVVRGAELLAQAGIAGFAAPSRRGRLAPSAPVAVSGAIATLAFGAVGLGVMREAGVDHDVRLLIGLGLWTLSAALLLAGLARLARRLQPPAPDQASPAAWLAEHWFGLATATVTFIWLSTLLVAVGAGIRALRAGALTMLLVGYAPALMHGVSEALRHLMTSRRGERRPGGSVWATALVRCSRILVLLGIGLVLLDIWDIDPIGLASDRLGEATVRAAVNVLFVILSAYVVWELVKAMVRGSAASQERAEQEASEEIGAPQPASRMQTFLPLLEKFLLVVVVVVAGLAAMKALGVDTGPLLAGAGIAGIAIGFGAQTLVRDIVSGIFFLLDDAFRLGEYVEIDQTRGTVEGISIRSLRIRHHRGAIHTVPFGTIQRLTNYSRDWIILKLEFLLAFETDLKKVKTIVKRIGEEMMQDPEYGQHFLEPVKSQGVRRMEQIGMVVGVKFMAKPGEQFILRREVYQRVRDAFEANGIRFARPQVVVQMPSGDTRTLDPEEADAIAGAATEAALPPPPPPEDIRRARSRR
ncbi:MAG: mechanosensitive ion channel family protein [Alsobacter sp.]